MTAGNLVAQAFCCILNLVYFCWQFSTHLFENKLERVPVPELIFATTETTQTFLQWTKTVNSCRVTRRRRTYIISWVGRDKHWLQRTIKQGFFNLACFCKSREYWDELELIEFFLHSVMCCAAISPAPPNKAPSPPTVEYGTL